MSTYIFALCNDDDVLSKFLNAFGDDLREIIIVMLNSNDFEITKSNLLGAKNDINIINSDLNYKNPNFWVEKHDDLYATTYKGNDIRFTKTQSFFIKNIFETQSTNDQLIVTSPIILNLFEKIGVDLKCDTSLIIQDSLKKEEESLNALKEIKNFDFNCICNNLKVQSWLVDYKFLTLEQFKHSNFLISKEQSITKNEKVSEIIKNNVPIEFNGEFIVYNDEIWFKPGKYNVDKAILHSFSENKIIEKNADYFVLKLSNLLSNSDVVAYEGKNPFYLFSFDDFDNFKILNEKNVPILKFNLNSKDLWIADDVVLNGNVKPFRDNIIIKIKNDTVTLDYEKDHQIQHIKEVTDIKQNKPSLLKTKLKLIKSKIKKLRKQAGNPTNTEYTTLDTCEIPGMNFMEIKYKKFVIDGVLTYQVTFPKVADYKTFASVGANVKINDFSNDKEYILQITQQNYTQTVHIYGINNDQRDYMFTLCDGLIRKSELAMSASENKIYFFANKHNWFLTNNGPKIIISKNSNFGNIETLNVANNMFQAIDIQKNVENIARDNKLETLNIANPIMTYEELFEVFKQIEKNPIISNYNIKGCYLFEAIRPLLFYGIYKLNISDSVADDTLKNIAVKNLKIQESHDQFTGNKIVIIDDVKQYFEEFNDETFGIFVLSSVTNNTNMYKNIYNMNKYDEYIKKSSVEGINIHNFENIVYDEIQMLTGVRYFSITPFVSRLKRHIDDYNFWIEYFSKNNIKEVYTTNSVYKTGMIEACRENHITISELQYALSSKNHPTYGFERKHYDVDNFYMWSSYWHEHTNVGKQQLTIKYFGKEKLKKLQNQEIQYDVCIVSQYTIYNQLIEYVNNLWEHNNQLKIAFCLHPRDDYNFIHGKLNKNIDTYKTDTIGIVAKSKKVVSVSSTTLFEAYYLNKECFSLKMPSQEVVIEHQNLFNLIEPNDFELENKVTHNKQIF